MNDAERRIAELQVEIDRLEWRKWIALVVLNVSVVAAWYGMVDFVAWLMGR